MKLKCGRTKWCLFFLLSQLLLPFQRCSHVMIHTAEEKSGIFLILHRLVFVSSNLVLNANSRSTSRAFFPRLLSLESPPSSPRLLSFSGRPLAEIIQRPFVLHTSTSFLKFCFQLSTIKRFFAISGSSLYCFGPVLSGCDSSLADCKRWK